MSEKIQLDDLVSSIEVPTGVNQTTAVIAEADPSDLNRAMLDSVNNHFKPLESDNGRLYDVQFAAKIHQERKHLTRPLKRTAAALGALAMGGSMYLGIQEMQDVQRLASTNASQEVVARDPGISEETIDRASAFFGILGVASGLLVGRMFANMVEETEAQRQARKIVKKAVAEHKQSQ